MITEELIQKLGKIVYDLDNINLDFPKGKAIEKAITLILSAVRDGLDIPAEARRTWFDEGLGIVGRSEPLKAYQALKVLLFNTVDIDPEDDVILIALRIKPLYEREHFCKVCGRVTIHKYIGPQLDKNLEVALHLWNCTECKAMISLDAPEDMALRCFRRETRRTRQRRAARRYG